MMHTSRAVFAAKRLRFWSIGFVLFGLLVCAPQAAIAQNEPPTSSDGQAVLKLFLPSVHGQPGALPLRAATEIGGSGSALQIATLSGAWSNPRNDIGDFPVTCEEMRNAGSDGAGESQVRYGQPYGAADCGEFGLRSGFGFERATLTQITPNRPFLLGRFTHYNQPIVSPRIPMDLVDLTLHLTGPDLAQPVDMVYTMRLEETFNSRKPCPYGATVADMCDDKVDFVSNTPQQTIVVNERAYVLEMLGFVPGDMGTCQYHAGIVDYFITAETMRNDACVIARLIDPPAPAIAVDKAPDLQQVTVGDDADFTITVSNIGNVGLVGVVVTDTQTPGCTQELGTLKAGAQVSFVCTAFAIENDFENVAIASGIFAGAEYTATDTAQIDVLAPDTASVHVTKYEDLNQNGARDANEPGLIGWKICAKDADGNTVGICKATDWEGNAVIAPNQAGEFSVCEELQPGWVNTDPGGDAACKSVTLSQGPLWVELAPEAPDMYLVELAQRSADELAWTYNVAQYQDSSNLNHWTLALPDCITADMIDDAATTPGYVFGVDDTPGGAALTGIRWDTPNGVAAAGTQFTLAFKRMFDAGATTTSVTNGADTPAGAMGAVAGPVCNPVVLLGNAREAPAQGTLEVRKSVVPATDDGRFDLLIDGVAVAHDVQNNGTTGAQPVAPGTHWIAEAAGTGSDLADYGSQVSCHNVTTRATWTPNADGAVAVDAGEQIVCMFQNTRTGTITIVKETNAAADQAWPFSGALGDFTLPAAGGQQTFARLRPGQYGVHEPATTGWTLESIECADPDNDTTTALATADAAIDLDPGETVICKFRNTTLTGTIEIVKEVAGAATSDWRFTGTLNAFTLPAAGGSKTFAALPPGSYNIYETATPGWRASVITCSDPDHGSSGDLFAGAAFVDLDPLETVTCKFTNVPAQPEITLEKRASDTIVYQGTIVTYTFSVGNPGQLPLNNVWIKDPMCDAAAITAGTYNSGDQNQDGWLTPGEEWLFTCALPLDADTRNTALAFGSSSDGQTVSAMDSVSVKVIGPKLSITKGASKTLIYSGETVSYTIDVENIGNGVLTNVLVEDGLAGCTLTNTANGNGDDALDNGEKWTYTCAVKLTQDTMNVATATAVDVKGNSLTAAASVFVDVIQPMIELKKEADKSFAYSGETVKFTVKVTNRGDQALYKVNVSDSLAQCRLSGPRGDNGNGRLDIGEEWTYTCSIAVCGKVHNFGAPSNIGVGVPDAADPMCTTPPPPTPTCGDVTNTATVTAKDQQGRTWTDSDSVLVDVINPSIQVSKTADHATIGAGQAVKFTVIVKNSGDTWLSNVNLSDSLPGCQLVRRCNAQEKLNPGEQWTYTCTMRLTKTTTNTASATARDPRGRTLTDSGSATVKVWSQNGCIHRASGDTIGCCNENTDAAAGAFELFVPYLGR